MYHLACEMLEGCCRGAARLLEEAKPDALAYLDFPASHWKRLRTNNLQARTNRIIKRRSRGVQTFQSTTSLERLVGGGDARRGRCVVAVALLLRGEDDRVEGPGGEPPAPSPPGREAELRLVAKQAIRARLEFADRIEADRMASRF